MIEATLKDGISKTIQLKLRGANVDIEDKIRVCHENNDDNIPDLF